MAGRTDAQILKAETDGLDVRLYTGVTDVSELPSAYKNAASVIADMRKFGLAEVVDTCGVDICRRHTATKYPASCHNSTNSELISPP